MTVQADRKARLADRVANTLESLAALYDRTTENDTSAYYQVKATIEALVAELEAVTARETRKDEAAAVVEAALHANQDFLLHDVPRSDAQVGLLNKNLAALEALSAAADTKEAE